MRVFLTGVSGYIGSRLAKRLTGMGVQVVGIDRENLNSAPYEFIHADLLDGPAYAAQLAGCDAIFHLAAAKGDWGISRQEYHRDNVEATKVLIEQAKSAGVDKWVFYSTVSVLGPSLHPLSEDAPRKPDNDYGWSKAVCEEMYDQYVADTPTATVISIRPSAVYGPHHPWNTNIYRLVETIRSGKFIMIGKGNEVKTSSYIDNLLDAHIFLMRKLDEKHFSGHHLYHAVDSPGLHTSELVALIYKYLEKTGPKLRLPLSAAAPIASVADIVGQLIGVDFPITSARVQKFCRATNFSAAKLLGEGFVQQHSNEGAVKETVAWHLGRGT